MLFEPGRKDGYLCVLNMKTGETEFEIEGHGSKGVLSMIANSPDDQVVSAGRGRKNGLLFIVSYYLFLFYFNHVFPANSKEEVIANSCKLFDLMSLFLLLTFCKWAFWFYQVLAELRVVSLSVQVN